MGKPFTVEYASSGCFFPKTDSSVSSTESSFCNECLLDMGLIIAIIVLDIAIGSWLSCQESSGSCGSLPHSLMAGSEYAKCFVHRYGKAGRECGARTCLWG